MPDDRRLTLSEAIARQLQNNPALRESSERMFQSFSSMLQANMETTGLAAQLREHSAALLESQGLRAQLEQIANSPAFEQLKATLATEVEPTVVEGGTAIESDTALAGEVSLGDESADHPVDLPRLSRPPLQTGDAALILSLFPLVLQLVEGDASSTEIAESTAWTAAILLVLLLIRQVRGPDA